MGRKSTIAGMPDDILKQLQTLLLDPRMTQLQITGKINKLLAAQGEKPVSKSSVGRYAQTFQGLTSKMAETNRMSTLILSELGISNQSDIGQVTAEILRTLVMHFLPLMETAMFSEALDLKDMKEVTLMINALSTTHHRLETSASENEKRKRSIELAATEYFVEKAENLTDNQPLTADRLRLLLKETYGG